MSKLVLANPNLDLGRIGGWWVGVLKARKELWFYWLLLVDLQRNSVMSAENEIYEREKYLLCCVNFLGISQEEHLSLCGTETYSGTGTSVTLLSKR